MEVEAEKQITAAWKGACVSLTGLLKISRDQLKQSNDENKRMRKELMDLREREQFFRLLLTAKGERRY